MTAARKQPRLAAVVAPEELEARRLGLARLAESGLDEEDARRLRVAFLTAAQTQALHPAFKALASLRLGYFDHRGEPLADWPAAPPFYRLRYLQVPNDFTQGSKKVPRYAQEPDTAPVAYLPTNLDWAEVVEDTATALVITEGELKAAKACREGFPTIGLGGVQNWHSHRKGLDWLPSLEPFRWLRRYVYVCFDSDYRTNEQVCTALARFAEALHRRGAYVHLVSLPTLEGLEKTGLDDFLVLHQEQGAARLEQLLHVAEPLGLTRPLWRLNERYVYVRCPGLVLDRVTQAKVAPGAFKDHLEATADYQEAQLRPDGSLSYKPVAAGAAWLRWPLRLEVTQLTYRPGAARFVEEGALRLYNTWPGWGVEPRAGDVEPFLRLLRHLFTQAEPEAFEWFLSWCAWPLQHPGCKLFSSAVLHGVRHGTGKSLVGYTLGAIYGRNFTEINQSHLHASFNEWAEAKQFVLGDDITGSNKRADADLLKKLITQHELRVNAKYVASYVVPDCINYLFTANHPDSFFLEDDDRRFFIHEVQVGPLPQEFYTAYWRWLHEGGAAAIFRYLLELDTSRFEPSAPAFRTAAKQRMIANVRSDLAGWVRDLLETPDHLLRVGDVALTQDLFSTKELLQLYDPTQRTGTTANGLGRELARAGVRQVLGGAPVRLPDGSQARYYVLRRPEVWLAPDVRPADVTKHLSATLKTRAKKY